MSDPAAGAAADQPAPDQDALEAAILATEALGPEIKLLAGLDTAGFADALEQVGSALASRPGEVAVALTRYASALAESSWASVGRSFGASLAGPMEVDPRDRRFQDPSWERNPWFFVLRQWYLAWGRLLHELVDGAGLDAATTGKAHFATDLLIDAASPTNVLWTNPAALRRAYETGGLSVLAGLKNFFHDMETNGGKPSQVDASAFRVGENLAATPGKVVFANDLMELIQYSPQTETVHEVPLLLSPPWINKYYIMDLAPGRSFVEWAVANGHTVFAISYRNPDESMREVGLDDYLLKGPYEALDVIADITGTDGVNVVGLCLGGTLTVMLLAHLAANAGGRVRSATLLNTLVDFSEPGPMGHFLDADSVERLSGQMAERGFLDSSEMAGMFDLLRGRDLIWNYVVSGWLMGEKPPAFDILAWNADGTRMPADMHSFYLRCCYVENQLARRGDDPGRHPAEARRGDRARLRAVGPRRPHRPVDVVVRHHPAPRGRRPLCFELVGPRGRDRQPADVAPQALDQRRPAGGARRLAGRRHRAGRVVVAGLGRLDRHGGRRAAAAAVDGQQALPARRRRPGKLRPPEVAPTPSLPPNR